MTTWAGARANIKTQLDGLQITSPGDETLSAFEYPPDAAQGANTIPYAYIVPPRMRVDRFPGGWRAMEIDDVTVRIFLAGRDPGGAERLAERRDAWVAALLTAFDDAVALDGTADVLRSQEFGELVVFEPEGYWGFAMELGLRVSESVTLGA